MLDFITNITSIKEWYDQLVVIIESWQGISHKLALPIQIRDKLQECSAGNMYIFRPCPYQQFMKWTDLDSSDKVFISTTGSLFATQCWVVQPKKHSAEWQYHFTKGKEGKRVVAEYSPETLTQIAIKDDGLSIRIMGKYRE